MFITIQTIRPMSKFQIREEPLFLKHMHQSTNLFCIDLSQP